MPDADGRVGVRKGELVRALIVAPLLKLSRAPFDHLIGTMQASTVLSKLLVKTGAESATIRRPDGFEVVVELVAASSSGANLRSTWLAGVIFDEADFHGDEDASVNLPDNLRAALTRMLPGAQVLVPSSPWADAGPFHELFTRYFGRPGREIAFHSDTRSMNPTLSKEEEDAERRRDPDSAAREYDAVPLSSSSRRFFPDEAVRGSVNSTRSMQLSPVDGLAHYAGCDLGFRKNSSALAIARFEGGKVRLAYYDELRPEKNKPLKPSEVCESFANACLSYRVRAVRGDLHYADTADEEFRKHKADGGLRTVRYESFQPTMEFTADAFAEFRKLMEEGRLELPDDPRLLKQIADVRSRPMPGGRIQVQLPKQAAAHGDLLMAVVLACVQVPSGNREVAKPPPLEFLFPESQALGFG